LPSGVSVGVTAGVAAGSGNNGASWQTFSVPSFTFGTASSYSFASFVPSGHDFFELSPTSAALPSGVTLNSAQKRFDYDGVGASTSVSGIVLRSFSMAAEWASQSAGAFYRHNFSFKNAAETQPITNKADLLASLGNYNGDASTYVALDTTIKLSGVGSMRIDMPASTWTNAYTGIDFAGIAATSKAVSKHQFYVRFAHYMDSVYRNWDWGSGNVWHTIVVECFNSSFDIGEVVLHPARVPGGYMMGYRKATDYPTHATFGLHWNAIGNNQTMNSFYDAGAPAVVNSVNTLQQRYGMLYSDWDTPSADADIVNQPRAVSNGWTVYEIYVDQVNDIVKIWMAPYGQAPVLLTGAMDAFLPAIGVTDAGSNPQPLYTGIQLANWRGSAPAQLPTQATFVAFAEVIASDNPIPFPGGFALPSPGTAAPYVGYPPAGATEV
jgi:hypothetical protein